MFYIGSCRSMYDHDCDYFPTRLHTTREKEPRIYPLWETILKHFAELEGIVLLAAYLSTTWYIENEYNTVFL